MARPSGSQSPFHFGVFELDLRAGELRKRGIRIKIQEQPLQILGLLVERPGEVITREQIQNKLWTGDTFVDFENAINSAVRKLRDALGDTSDNPRFVETVARRGYRFIAPVTQDLTASHHIRAASVVPVSADPTPTPTPDIERLSVAEQPAIPATRNRSRTLLWVLLTAAVSVFTATATFWRASRPPAQEFWSGVMLGVPANAFQPRLSPDGQLLAFLAFIDQLPQVAVMKPNGGSWTPLTNDREHGCVITAAWAPDGSKIYFDRVWGYPIGIYSVPPLGGETRMLLEQAFGPEPLPDGSLIVVKMTEKGDNQLFHFWPESGKLEALPGYLTSWSDVTPMLRAFPDGKEIVYFGTTEKERSHSPRMLVLNLASRQTRELAPGLPVDPGADAWSPLDTAPGGQSVYLVSTAGDARWLVEVARKPDGKRSPLLSFPEWAMPVAIDVTPDGSLYLDLLRNQFVLLRVSASGGAGEEFGLPTNNFLTMVSPRGDVLFELPGWGRHRLAAVRPGGQARVLVETSEDTTLPATTFGGNVAFTIGSGDQRRIAVASLGDGHVLRRFSMRSENGMAASPDGHTLYYSFGGAVWAQPVAGGEARRITEGTDVTIDPGGQYLYVKRAVKGRSGITRIPVAGGDAEDLPVPPEYHLPNPALSPAAVDGRGRILVSVISKHSFYYETAILDPASKSFTLVPMAIDGDAAMAGWAPDGRILARGHRYSLSLWRYQRSIGLH